MTLKQITKDIFTIVPKSKHKKLFWFLWNSILFGLLDLVSIAYLVPILILLFDPSKFYEIVSHFDFLKSRMSTSTIQIGAIVFVIFYLVKITFQTKFTTSMHLFIYDLSTDLSIKSINNFVNENFIKHQKINCGEVLQNVNNVAEDFTSRYLMAVVNLVSESIILLLLLGVLFFIYFKITLIAIIALLFFAGFIYATKKNQMKIINTVYHKTQAKSNASLLNILNGYLEIRNSGNYAFFLNEFKKNKALLNKVTSRLNAYNSNYTKYLEGCLIVSIVCLMLFSFENQNTIVLLSVLGAASLRLIPSISKILNVITIIKSYNYSVKILLENKKSEVLVSEEAAFQSEIKLENIFFHYEENELLASLNLTIPKGKFIGIKGKSGLGKTTLLYIILGIIKPKKGNYFIDHTLLTNSRFLSFANYVPQQPFLFNGTIIENIVMGQEPDKIDYDYIDYLCHNLELDVIIDKMKNQYDTEIVHDSLRLSGGQKQRLALVRALYTKPSLLILDEATNQQDSALEKKIMAFLNDLKNNTNLTLVCISHNNDLDAFFDSTYEIKNKKLISLK